MARMVAPYTGVIHDVDEAKVAARLAKGFRLIAAYAEPEPAAEDAHDPVHPPATPPRASTTPANRPDATAAHLPPPAGNTTAPAPPPAAG